MIRSYLLDELDKIVALVGVIFSLILTIWIKLVIGHPIFVIVGILCFIICTGYLIIRKFFYPSLIPSSEELRVSTRFYITLNIFFFLLLSYSIILIYIRPDPYVRPLWYFISTVLMAAIVSEEILFLSTKKSHIYFILFKIIIIGLSLQYSQILIFPNVVGVDPWWHQWFTLRMLDNGHIPEGLQYSKLPMMHLMIGMTSLVTDLGYKMATMISISFLQVVCDALFVFLLGKFLISTKVGLLAALLLEVAPHHILYGYLAYPNTMAATLILPIIFILLKVRKDKPFIGTSVVMFLMGILILTHTVTAMFLAILLFVFWLSFESYNRLFNQETGRSVTWKICILFSTMMLAYWSYISGHIIILSNLIKLGFHNPLFEGRYQYLSYIPLQEQIFNNLGLFLFFGLSFIGFFYTISKQFRNRNRFINTIGGMVILCIAFFSFITEKNIIVGRWYYFSQILMAVPLSLSLFFLNGIFKHKFIKGFLMFLLVFTLSFLFIISTTSNMDNHFFSPNTGIRYGFTKSEIIGASFFARNSLGNISSDFHYIRNPSSSIFANYYNVGYNRILSLDDSLNSGNFTRDGSIKIIRREIVNRPFCTAGGIYRIDYDPNIVLTNSGFNKIYDSYSITAYR